MILALDDDVPAGRRRGDPRRRGGPRPVDDPPRARAVTAGRRRRPAPIPAGLDATLVLVRHGESEWVARGPVPGPGRDAAPPARAGARRRSPRRGSPRRTRPPGLPHPAGRAARDRPFAARAHDRDRRRDRRGGDAAGRRRRRPRRLAPEPGFLEIGQGEWEGLHRRRDRSALGRRELAALAATRRPRRGRRAASRSPRSTARVRPALAGILARARDGGDAGHASTGPQVAGYARRPVDAAVVDRRRPRRRVQGRAAGAARPAARAVLDVAVRAVRDHGRRVPRRPARPARAQPDRAPGGAARRGGRSRGPEARSRERARSEPRGRRPLSGAAAAAASEAEARQRRRGAARCGPSAVSRSPPSAARRRPPRPWRAATVVELGRAAAPRRPGRRRTRRPSGWAAARTRGGAARRAIGRTPCRGRIGSRGPRRRRPNGEGHDDHPGDRDRDERPGVPVVRLGAGAGAAGASIVRGHRAAVRSAGAAATGRPGARRATGRAGRDRGAAHGAAGRVESIQP